MKSWRKIWKCLYDACNLNMLCRHISPLCIQVHLDIFGYFLNGFSDAPWTVFELNCIPYRWDLAWHEILFPLEFTAISVESLNALPKCPSSWMTMEFGETWEANAASESPLLAFPFPPRAARIFPLSSMATANCLRLLDSTFFLLLSFTGTLT